MQLGLYILNLQNHQYLCVLNITKQLFTCNDSDNTWHLTDVMLPSKLCEVFFSWLAGFMSVCSWNQPRCFEYSTNKLLRILEYKVYPSNINKYRNIFQPHQLLLLLNTHDLIITFSLCVSFYLHFFSLDK